MINLICYLKLAVDNHTHQTFAIKSPFWNIYANKQIMFYHLYLKRNKSLTMSLNLKHIDKMVCFNP